MNLGASLGKKLGPLPAWGWGAIIGVAGLGYVALRGGKGTPQEEAVTVPTQLIPTGPSQIDPSSGFINEMSVQWTRMEHLLTGIKDKLAAPAAVVTPNPNPPQPGKASLMDLGTYVMTVRSRFPSLYAAYQKATHLGPTKQRPGESKIERNQRLNRELAYYISSNPAVGPLPAISAKP